MATHNFFHWLVTAFWIVAKALPLIGVGLAIALIGFLIFQNATVSWWKIAVGLPLILLGLSIAIVNLYEVLASILDRQYSRSHCPICQERE